MLRLVIVLALVACSSSSKSSSTPTTAAAGGTLAGKVTFVGTPCPQPSGPPCDGPYPGYKLVVYAEDGTTVAGETVTAADGTFTLSLPEGKYVIFTQAGLGENDRRRTDVAVARDAVATVDLSVDTGVR